ncbi:MAG: hypothetical protein IJI45_10675 [Anaerolineaceae bacterium]|nr:hypothetical protein [Oscillospiraceae bacterium]MBQ6481571.1 hypothetical protein [Anaerolineaceae bacterium]
MEKIFCDLEKEVDNEFREKGTFFLEREYILSLQEELNVFPRIINDLLTASDRIRKDKEAARYALLVYRAMKDREAFKKNLPLVDFPEDHPFLPLFCLLPSIRPTFRFLKEKSVPQDIIAKTLSQYETCVFLYSERYNRLGLNKRYFDWLQYYVDCEILDIDRLRFEMKRLYDPVSLVEDRRTETRFLLYHDPQNLPDHESKCGIEGRPVSADGQIGSETEHYPEDRYRILIRPGDQCLGVHIPEEGEFSESACEESYKRAKSVFASCFPEFDYKGFHCESWMMAPQLKQYLKPGSNILSFSGKFLKYPIPSEGKDVLNFVFLLKFTSYDDLPEDTSLQRNLKRLYQSGGKLYEYGGLRYIAG